MNFLELEIKEDFIKLDSALKFSSLVPTGGIAKMVILDGLVKVNGEVCTQRGKKLVAGDIVSFEGNEIKIVG